MFCIAGHSVNGEAMEVSSAGAKAGRTRARVPIFADSSLHEGRVRASVFDDASDRQVAAPSR